MLRPSFSLLASLFAASALLAKSTPIQRGSGGSSQLHERDSAADVETLTVNFEALLADAWASSNTDTTATAQPQKRDVQAHWDYARCPAFGNSPGPRLSPDTPENFKGNAWLAIAFGQTPSTAAPEGFSRAYIGADGLPFADTDASVIKVLPLDSYDVGKCKSYCDELNCQAFSTYMSRDTNVDLNNVDLNMCNNPPSLTTYNCALYSTTISKSMTSTHQGVLKGDYFRTAIAAANGYVRRDVFRPIAGYSGMTYPGGSTSNGYTSQFLLKVYNPNQHAGAIGYVPEACATYCDGEKECVGFDVSATTADGQFVGTECLIYKSLIGLDQANNPGQWGNDGKWYSFQPSVFYIKGVVAEPEPPKPEPPAPEPSVPVYIENAGFENLAMAPWTVEGKFGNVVAVLPHTGRRCMSLGYLGSQGSMTYGPDLPATPDRDYVITFWLSNPLRSARSKFNVVWNGVTVYSETGDTIYRWKEVKVTVKSQASNKLSFTGSQDKTISYYLLDDVSIAPA